MATAPDRIIIKLVDPISPGAKNKQRTHQHKGEYGYMHILTVIFICHRSK